MHSHLEPLIRLCTLLEPHAKPGVAIGVDTRLAADLGLDSAQFLELLLEVEDAFDLSIPLNILPEVQTVGDLAAALERLRACAP